MFNKTLFFLFFLLLNFLANSCRSASPDERREPQHETTPLQPPQHGGKDPGPDARPASPDGLGSGNEGGSDSSSSSESSDEDQEEKKKEAATTIQKTYRGFKTRKEQPSGGEASSSSSSSSEEESEDVSLEPEDKSAYSNSFDDETTSELKRTAIRDGYGFKSANLILLDKALSSFASGTSLKYEVPAFVAISNQAMHKFFEEELNFDLKAKWKTIIDSSKLDHKKALKEALDSKSFPSGFLEACSQLESDIKKAFTQYAQDLTGDRLRFSDMFGYSNIKESKAYASARGFRQWGEKDQISLMVRSTGKEDTDLLANAGGNESIANVPHQDQAVLTAIGNVIASYFGSKSLLQRLASGDKTFHYDPFVPVLIQRMIGETAGGPLPTSGVLFTEETGAALSKRTLRNEKGEFLDSEGNVISRDKAQTQSRIRDEDGRIITSGITMLQSTFGHNEGVVTSTVPVDTTLVDQLGFAWPIVMPKHSRIAPISSGGLGKVDNDRRLKGKMTLTADLSTALKNLSTSLEGFYGKSIDSEWTSLGNKVYVLQARPVVHKLDQPQPSYLDLTREEFDEGRIRVSVVESAGGSLRFMKKSEDFVLAETIREADLLFRELAHQDLVQGIFVKDEPLVTSHEVNEFRGKLKPVIHLGAQYQDFASQVRGGNFSLVLDTQQQLVWKASSQDSFDIDAYLQEGFARAGWISFPAAKKVSVELERGRSLYSENRKKLKKLFDQKINVSRQKALWGEVQSPDFNTKSIREEINLLKIGSEAEAMDSLFKLWSWAFSHLMSFSSEGYQERSEALLGFLSQSFLSLVPNLPLTQDSELFLTERLFYIHFAEVLFFQSHKELDGYWGDSVLKLKAQHDREKKATKSGVDTDAKEQAKLAAILGEEAFTPKTKALWIELLNSLKDKSEETQKAFYENLMILGQVEVLPLWLNGVFVDNPEDIDLLNKGVTQDRKFLAQIKFYRDKVEALQPDLFAEPGSFLTALEQLKKEILPYFLGSFPRHFAKSQKAGKMAALGLMKDLVEKFDASIKAVTSSGVFEGKILPDGKKISDFLTSEAEIKRGVEVEKNKVFAFHLMLEQYSLMLKSWVRLTPQWLNGNPNLFTSNSWSGPKKVVDDLIFGKINKRFVYENGAPGSLQSHPEFNVNAHLFTSTLAKDRRREIETHEELFTGLHQNLLLVVADLMKNHGLEITSLPALLQKAHGKLMESFVELTLIGIEISGKNLRLSYNYPQRNHSAMMELVFNVKSSQFSLSFDMQGTNYTEHNERWRRIYEYLLLKERDNQIPVEARVEYTGVRAQWTFAENEGSLDTLIVMMKHMADFSNHCDVSRFFRPAPTDFSFFLEKAREGIFLINSYELIQKRLDVNTPGEFEETFELLSLGIAYFKDHEDYLPIPRDHTYMTKYLLFYLERILTEEGFSEHVNDPTINRLFSENFEDLLHQAYNGFLKELIKGDFFKTWKIRENLKRKVMTLLFYMERKKSLFQDIVTSFIDKHKTDFPPLEGDELRAFIVSRGDKAFIFPYKKGFLGGQFSRFSGEEQDNFLKGLLGFVQRGFLKTKYSKDVLAGLLADEPIHPKVIALVKSQSKIVIKSLRFHGIISLLKVYSLLRPDLEPFKKASAVDQLDDEEEVTDLLGEAQTAFEKLSEEERVLSFSKFGESITRYLDDRF